MFPDPRHDASSAVVHDPHSVNSVSLGSDKRNKLPLFHDSPLELSILSSSAAEIHRYDRQGRKANRGAMEGTDARSTLNNNSCEKQHHH